MIGDVSVTAESIKTTSPEPPLRLFPSPLQQPDILPSPRLSSRFSAMSSRKQASSDIVDYTSPSAESHAEHQHHFGAPPFSWSSLWKSPVVNHLNGKSYTLPIFNLANPYSRNFHLSWLGFFVAFLSWFAFPPLLPEAIKTDLKLTTAQIGNSNIIALLATFLVRMAMGPAVDRFGPRKCMAAMLMVGAIPSGMAGLVKGYKGLYAVRFFIGILGGTFVPCQAWTTLFFDKNIVGTANALVGGWGNLGGGVTFVVMVSLFQSLVDRGLSGHSAWRAAYAIVPVPILFFVAAITLIFGTDCPAGKWSDRHKLPASTFAIRHGHAAAIAHDAYKGNDKEQGNATVAAVDPEDEANITSDLDVAVNESLTLSAAGKIFISPYTWLPALMYMTTFGFELAIDSNLANVFFNIHKSATFTQTKAGYYASIFGFLNFVTRPFGGWCGDFIGRKYGIKGKKYLTVTLGFLQGTMALGFGLWSKHQQSHKIVPNLNTQIGFVVLMAVFCEMANGANFALVPHCNSFNNGVMSGIVGAMGNLGGILFALIFRFHSANGFTEAMWISGAFAMGVNFLCGFIPAPKPLSS